MEIRIYGCEDRTGDLDTYTTLYRHEAEAYALRNKLRCVVMVCECTETLVIKDFTVDPDGGEAGGSE